MRSPAGQQNPPDGRGTDCAWLAGSQIDLVLQLKETAHAVGVYIIRDGRAAQLDGVSQHLLDGAMQPEELRPREPSSHAPGADSRAKKAFVGVDIADPMQKALVK